MADDSCSAKSESNMQMAVAGRVQNYKGLHSLGHVKQERTM